MPLYLGWAGSPQSLARRACRYVFLDEVDKYPPFSGREGDPISLARGRSRTFKHRKKVVIGSTPTTKNGAICKAFEGCGDKRRFYVPCPHCGEYQTLAFGRIRFGEGDDVPEDKVARADRIEQRQTAYYECEFCEGKILDRHKPSMLTAGVWLSDGQTIDRQGDISGERPKSKRVGFQISALYSPWVSFSEMAGQFLRATGDTGALMEFYNQWLGLPFEQIVSVVKTDDLRGRIKRDLRVRGRFERLAGAIRGDPIGLRL